MDSSSALLARLRRFCFPSGEDSVRLARGVKTAQRGEMRMAPGAKPVPFTAEESIQAARSGFRWEARFGGGRLGGFAVTDAYDEGRGWLLVKLRGVIPLKKTVGPEVDQGELQRYLASVVSCPPMILHNRSLEWTAAGPDTLRVRDRDDPTGATVDLEMDAEGRPLACRAVRPRMAGKRIVPTPWSGVAAEFREWEGLRVASRLEVQWDLPEGSFTYFRAEVTSFALLL